MDSRTTADAVHQIFRAPYFFCLTCTAEFSSDKIELHYSYPHASGQCCAYCKISSVHQYRDHRQVIQVWHKCPSRP